ncbi:MAG: DNA recombination protein RmuC [Bacteroidota bacterium]|nr:DNA recombination protein RmuC [Bacteroidota bacterium]
MEYLMLIILLLILLIAIYFYVQLQKPKSSETTSLLFEMNKQLRDDIEKMRKSVESFSGENRKEIQEKLDGIHKGMDAFQKHTKDSLQKQFTDTTTIITRVSEKLKGLEITNKQVLSFTEQMKSLEKILQNPKQRGIFGEIQLSNLLANVLPPDHYQMQYSFKNGDKVDAVLFYNNFIVPIDSKFSLENYNKMVDEDNSTLKRDFENEFKKDIKNRINETAKYIRPNENTTEYAFMFIPADGLYQSLLSNKVGTLEVNSTNLIEYAFNKKVMIVSPMSLFPYLQTALKALNELKMEANIEIIKKNLFNLTNHLKAYEDCIQRLGKNLGTVVNQYNEASSEFKKIDKDVIKISSGEMEIGFEPNVLEKPKKIFQDDL